MGIAEPEVLQTSAQHVSRVLPSIIEEDDTCVQGERSLNRNPEPDEVAGEWKNIRLMGLRLDNFDLNLSLWGKPSAKAPNKMSAGLLFYWLRCFKAVKHQIQWKCLVNPLF